MKPVHKITHNNLLIVSISQCYIFLKIDLLIQSNENNHKRIMSADIKCIWLSRINYDNHKWNVIKL